MQDEITRAWLRRNAFGHLLDEERAEERSRIAGVLAVAAKAGLAPGDELLEELVGDPSASAERAAARIFERGIAAREQAEARERAQGAAHLQALRDAEARLAPHVPAPDTGQDDGEDFGALVRRAGDAAAAARGGVG